MPVDRTSRLTYGVEASVFLKRPGCCRIEGLSGEGGSVTVTTTLEIEGG